MTASNTCGCCAGISVQTPQGESNLPGLSAIAYRTGTWASFFESMLARLSSSDYPALAYLKTRDDDDFTIALLDASAVMLDILTFYQERLANESYLRTATQLYSMVQLSQLIGYQPSPGVAASTYLAFTITAATGLPANPATTALTIPAGTQVQSVPPQGQSPQAFETSSDILAKADWNALPVQTGYPWVPDTKHTSLYLSGTSTQLNPGDAILIVGDERIGSPSSPHWDVRMVTSVQPDNVNGRTLVTWSEPLGAPGSGPAQKNPVFYAMRQRATLFGYGAVDPRMLAEKTYAALAHDGLIDTSTDDWYFGGTSGTLVSQRLVDLDAVYSKLTPGDWLAIGHPDDNPSRSPSGFISLYLAESITSLPRSDYAMSAKISRVHTDTSNNLKEYYSRTRSAWVLTQSEALPVAEQPLDHPLYGTFLDLEIVRDDLVGVNAVAVTGNSQKLSVNAGINLTFVPDDTSAEVPLAPGDIVSVIAPPDFLHADGSIPNWSTADKNLVLYVADTNGRTGTVDCTLSNFSLAPASSSDPVVQEVALVASVEHVGKPFAHTRIVLQNKLLNCYERSVTTVNANVGPATAGSTVAELLGSGSASTPNQQFTLNQTPLTYVQAPTPTGSLSTLQVTANGVAWTPVQTLYDQPPTAQVFSTLNLPGGVAQVQFGDGVEGATLPTGQNNIQANFRVGLGSAGNVAAGSLTTLVNRPLGVYAATNPLPATGGQDAQSVDDIRSNAPLSVLTLGRAVSITDYQDLAASFAGIAKASAVWIPSGQHRGVFLTLAGAGGTALEPPNATLTALVAALKGYGNPNIAIWPKSFLETTFDLTADILYDPAYDASTVEATILALLQQTYSFASRTFGQGVSADEIAALIQGVAGVIAVNVKHIAIVATSKAGDLGSAAFSVSAYNNWMAQKLANPLPRPSSGSKSIICPYIPVATPGKLPHPAEILVLDPDPKNVVLGTMR